MRGKERLAAVFWYYYVLGYLGIALVFVGAVVIVESFDLPSVMMAVVAVLLSLPILAYQVWSNISLWACAFNVENRMWGYLARLWVLMSIFGTVDTVSEILKEVL